MKIAIVTSMTGFGGTENASLRLGQMLMNMGHEVHLVASSGPLIEKAIAAGATWHEVDFYNKGIFGYLGAVIKIIVLLRKIRPNILDCQMARPVLGCILARSISRTTTGIVWHSRGLRASTYRLVCYIFSQNAVMAIGNCKLEAEKLIRYGYKPSSTSFTYNPLPVLDATKSRIINTEVVLGTISRLTNDRNIEEAIYTLHLLRNKGQRLKLMVGGDGPDRSRLEELALTLGLKEHIKFLGQIDSLNEFYNAIDILINTLSLKGDTGAGVGNNILEASIFSIPVVSYDSCGIREMVINSVTGYCVPIDNRSEFLSRVSELVESSELRFRLGKALNEHVAKECSAEGIYSKTVQVYEQAIEAVKMR